MVRVDGDDVRGRLADTIPDKYHLTRSAVKCLLCGVQKAVHEVLRQNMAGAHLILITRWVQGGARRLKNNAFNSQRPFV